MRIFFTGCTQRLFNKKLEAEKQNSAIHLRKGVGKNLVIAKLGWINTATGVLSFAVSNPIHSCSVLSEYWSTLKMFLCFVYYILSRHTYKVLHKTWLYTKKRSHLFFFSFSFKYCNMHCGSHAVLAVDPSRIGNWVKKACRYTQCFLNTEIRPKASTL